VLLFAVIIARQVPLLSPMLSFVPENINAFPLSCVYDQVSSIIVFLRTGDDTILPTAI